MIEEGIKSIPKNAFSSCTQLVNVLIPESVISIGESAFAGCGRLVTVNIPSKLETLGASVFTNTWALKTHITIPGTVKIIEARIISNSGITGVTLQEGTTTINTSAFSGAAITEITIPDSVTTIASKAFESTAKLKSIFIPTKISGSIVGSPWESSATVYWDDIVINGDWAFNTTTNSIAKYMGTNPNVVIPKTMVIDGLNYQVKSLELAVFKNNENITSVQIQDNIKEIPKDTFSGSINLETVSIADSVVKIGDNAFSECSKLTAIKLPSALEYIGRSAFSGCTKLTEIKIPESVTAISDGAFSSTGLIEMTIPDSVTFISHSLFDNCADLTNVTLPSKISGMQQTVFTNTPSLEKIYVMSTRDGTPDSIKDIQPWGAKNAVKVLYLGEFISFEHTVKPVSNEYAREIVINASTIKSKIVSITDHEGNLINVGGKKWTTTIKVVANSLYEFSAIDSGGETTEYTILINDIGTPTISAVDINLPYSKKNTVTKDEIIAASSASSNTETGDTTLDINISDDELAVIKNLTASGQTGEVRMTVTNPEPWNITSEIVINVTLIVDQITKPNVDNTIFTYNALEQTYAIADNPAYTVSGNKQTNAGTYSVKVSLKDKVNTQWADGSVDDITYNFVINKAVPSIIIHANKVLAKTSGNYGDNFNLTADVIASHGIPNGTIQFMDNNVNIGNEITVVNGVASYKYENLPLGQRTITANFKATGASATDTAINFEDVSAIKIISIDKKEVVPPDADATVFTYNNAEQTYFIAPNSDYKVEHNVQTNVGNYSVTVSLKDKLNTVWTDGSVNDITFNFVINKADPTIVLTAEKVVTRTSGNYGDSFDITANITGVNGELPTGTIQFMDNSINIGTEITVVNGIATYKYENLPLGENTITANFKATSSSLTDTVINYNDASKISVISIDKKQVTKPVADATIFTYNNSAHTYLIASNSDYKVENNVQTNAGTYSVKVSLKDKVNTQWADGSVDNITFDFVINKAVVSQVDLSALITNPIKSSTPQSVFEDQLEYTGTIKWSSNDSTFKPDTVYTATLNLLENSNYTFNGLGANSFKHDMATSIISDVNSGVVIITFPATEANDSEVINYYTLTFDSNGGTSISPKSYIYSQNVSLNQKPTKKGYNFAGWYLDNSLKIRTYSVVMDKNKTVYAKWIKAETDDNILIPLEPIIEVSDVDDNNISDIIVETEDKEEKEDESNPDTSRPDYGHESPDCFIHWILWVASLLLFIIMIIKRKKNLEYLNRLVELGGMDE